MTYFDWLSRMLIPNDTIRDSYQKLMSALYKEKFIYFIENDSNRARDGERLRTIYENETGQWCNNYNPCSVLEMLGGLALRWENELMYDPDCGDRTSIWFWEMLCNLDLDCLDDWHFNYEKFNRIMKRLNDRTYDSDGFGGPFYIAGFTMDMTKIELWYQLNYYVSSKYDW